MELAILLILVLAAIGSALWCAAGALTGPQDASLAFYNAATVAATADSATIDLGVGFAPDPIAPLSIQGLVTALDLSSANETYSLTLWESSDNTNWTTTGLTMALTATGAVHKIAGVTKRYLKIIATLGGTTPSMTLSLWANRA